MRHRNDLDSARFHQHWLDIRGKLVCRMRDRRGYAQSQVIAALTPTARAI